MTSTTVGTGLFQTLDVVQNVSAQVVLNLHFRKHGSEVEDLLVGELTDTACWVDVEAGQETAGSVWTNSEEALEGFLFRQFALVDLLRAQSEIAAH